MLFPSLPVFGHGHELVHHRMQAWLERTDLGDTVKRCRACVSQWACMGPFI